MNRAVLCAFLLVFPAPLAAQVVEVRLVEELTEEPVAAAHVALLAGGGVAAVGETDSSGVARVRVPAAGEYGIQVTALGYALQADRTVKVEAGDTIRVLLELARDPVRLPELRVVNAGRLTPGRQVYDRRCELGTGICLNAVDIQSSSAPALSNLIGELPGLRMQPTAGSRNRQNRLVSTRGDRCLRVLHNGVPNRGDRFGEPVRAAPSAQPRRPRGRSVESRLDPEDGLRSESLVDHIDPRLVRGIEVYATWYDVPEELKLLAWHGRKLCGVVVIWTRAAW